MNPRVEFALESYSTNYRILIFSPNASCESAVLQLDKCVVILHRVPMVVQDQRDSRELMDLRAREELWVLLDVLEKGYVQVIVVLQEVRHSY